MVPVRFPFDHMIAKDDDSVNLGQKRTYFARWVTGKELFTGCNPTVRNIPPDAAFGKQVSPAYLSLLRCG
jgi:hypothetical protein